MEKRTSNPDASSSTGHDLMARFDMAKDRADRLPKVRAYLENLRPQILELQKRLKLQTQEDIDGLETRDDLDMNDVDELVALIKLFSKAWKENRLEHGEENRVEAAEAMKVAGPAWREFVEVVEIDVERKGAEGEREDDVTEERALNLARVAALAGEAEMALRWFRRANSRGSSSTEWKADGHAVVPAMTAIWQGLKRKGTACDLNATTIAQYFLRKESWHEMAFGFAEVRPRVGVELVRALVAEGEVERAISVVPGITFARHRLDAVLFLARVGNTARAHQLVRDFEMALFTQSAYDQLDYWFRIGDVGRAEREYENNRWKNTALIGVLAGGYARRREVNKAFETLAKIEVNVVRSEAVGRMAVAFLENGDVSDVWRVLTENEERWKHISADDTIEIVRRLLNDKRDARLRDLAVRVAQAKTTCNRFTTHQPEAEAFVTIVTMLAEAGIDTKPMFDIVKESMAKDGIASANDMKFGDAIATAKAAAALRTFKRAARMYRPHGTSPSADWDRRAWERAMRDALTVRPDLAEALTYDPPIERT